MILCQGNWGVSSVFAAGEVMMQGKDDNFRTFFDNMGDIIIVGSPDGKIFYTNPAASLKLGYSPAELNGMHVLDVHSADKRREAEQIFAAMFKGERETCPLPLQHKDGSFVPVETRVWFGKWSGADCIFGLCRDLSREQEALQKFDRLFRNNPASMAFSVLPGREFTDVNDAWLKTLGYSREEVIGKTSEELGLFAQPERGHEVAEQLLAYGRIADLELKVKRKDGMVLDGLFSGEIIESQGEKYFLTVMIDQTQRKKSEAVLMDSEERFALAIDGTGAGLWDWDMPTGRISYSIQWKRMLGCEKHEVEDSFSGWKNLWHPDDSALIEQSMEDYLSGNASRFEIIYRMRHKDGGWRWILTRGDVVRDAQGKPCRWVGTNLDITEQRRMEETLRESESLKIREELLENALTITKNTLRDIVSLLSKIVELRDSSTAGHHIRVARLATAIAKKMGLTEEQNGYVQTAAMLHDIGRIYISTELLNKTGPLIDLEYKLVQMHAQKSYATVKDIDFQGPIAEIVYQHHERMDGSGYPRKLRGSEILMEARILAVAEVVDAMLTHRPYRQAPGIEKALQELSSNKGIKYDKAAVDACLELFQSENFDIQSA